MTVCCGLMYGGRGGRGVGTVKCSNRESVVPPSFSPVGRDTGEVLSAPEMAISIGLVSSLPESCQRSPRFVRERIFLRKPNDGLLLAQSDWPGVSHPAGWVRRRREHR